MVVTKGGIFEAGFGEILRSPHLQWAGKRKFASWFTNPSLTDPTLGCYIGPVVAYLGLVDLEARVTGPALGAAWYLLNV